MRPKLSARFNDAKDVSDSNQRREPWQAEAGFDRDFQGCNSFGSAVKQIRQNVSLKSSPGGDGCMPAHDELPVSSQNLPASLEKCEDSEITGTPNEIRDDKTPTTANGFSQSRERLSQLTATQEKVQSITNYYNILNQRMQAKVPPETKHSNPNEKGRAMIGDHARSQAQKVDVNGSPNTSNLQGLATNYNSNQNYQSISFFDEVNKDNKVATRRFSKKECSADAFGTKGSRQHGDYTDQEMPGNAVLPENSDQAGRYSPISRQSCRQK